MTNSDNIKKKAMIEALTKSLGIVTNACKDVEISRQTHYRWMQEDEDYKKAVEDVADIAIDFAESALHKQIKENDTTATIFYLKTKGKKRGYVEKIELDHTGSIIIDFTNE
jgi:flagellar hook protein FlgE